MTPWTTRRPITQQIAPCDRLDWLREGGAARLSQKVARRVVSLHWVPWVVAVVCLAVAVWRRFG